MLALTQLLDGLGSPRILVLGDLMLDRYTWGDASRVSPEAPVLVLRAEMDEVRLGGAASVAALLRGLDAEVTLAGVLGDDADGRVARRLLDEAGIDTSLIFCDGTRPTTCKQRIVGRAAGRHPHQIVRIDQEQTHPLRPALARRLATAILSRLSDRQAVLISDYGKGVCTPQVLAAVIKAARRRDVPVIVDPARGSDFARYQRASLIKPNRCEAEAALGRTIGAPGEGLAAARQLCETLQTEAALVTLEADGMALATAAGDDRLLPVRPRAVYDVTGAGDMAMAALALARAGGAAWAEAAELANLAAGLQVERFGVSPVSREELAQGIGNRAQGIGDRAQGIGHREQRTVGIADSSVTCSLCPIPCSQQKVVALNRLEKLVKEHRAAGRSIVMVNGVFDLLHVGHVRCLEEAARLGDVLIVAINNDATARLLKGAPRPIVGERGRAGVLAALACVDYVVIFGQRTPHRLLRVLRPDVLVKGGDYQPSQVVGREFVASYGGRVAVTSRVARTSTTRLLKTATGSPGPCGRPHCPGRCRQP